MELLKELVNSVLSGNKNNVIKIIEEGLSLNIEPKVLITEGLIEGMNQAGVKWSNGEFFIPQVIIASRAMNEGLKVLEPLLTTDITKETIVIGTVEGDLHDIGKNLVIMMLKGKGYNVIDLKTDVSTSKFIEAIKEHKPKVLCMSALLSTTMQNMEKVVMEIEKENLRENLLIACGGAPVTKEFVNSINADIYESDATSFANLLTNIL